MDPASQREDGEELERQGGARLSPGKRKLPERLYVLQEVGQGTRVDGGSVQVLHHVPNKQLGGLQ